MDWKGGGKPVFLSTPSARRATCFLSIDGYLLYDFYPRPPRGGRPNNFHDFIPFIPISIHALREEGDRDFLEVPEGGELFLSTPSARRATSWLPAFWRNR